MLQLLQGHQNNNKKNQVCAKITCQDKTQSTVYCLCKPVSTVHKLWVTMATVSTSGGCCMLTSNDYKVQETVPDLNTGYVVWSTRERVNAQADIKITIILQYYYI